MHAEGKEHSMAPVRRAWTRRAVGGALVTTSLVAACRVAGRGSESTPEIAPPPKLSSTPVTISFSFWGTATGLLRMNTELAEMFQKEYPTIKVNLIFNPDNYYDKLQTLFAGGVAPDVFDISTPQFPAWAKRDTMIDLEPYVRRDQGKDFDWNDLWPRHRDSGRYNGKLYGILARVSPFVMYYNPSMFARQGLRNPTADWTWADFIDVARKLTRDVDGDGRIDEFGYVPVNINHWIWGNGGDWIEERPDGKWKVGAGQPAVIEAIQLLADIRHRYHVSPTPSELANRTYITMFQDGQTAMHDALVARVTDYRVNPKMTIDTWDVVHLPKGRGNRSTDMDRVVRCISVQSKLPEEAWLFQKFYLKYPAVTAVSMPSRMSWVKSDEFLRPGEPPRNMKVFLEALEYARTVPAHERWSELSAVIDRELRPVWEGAQGAAEACRAIEQQLTALLSQWGDLAR